MYKDIETRRAYARTYNDKHKERLLVQVVAWNKAHPAKCVASRRKYECSRQQYNKEVRRLAHIYRACC
jgi:hypothetical protein